MQLVTQLADHWSKTNMGGRRRHKLTTGKISSCLGNTQDHLAATQRSCLLGRVCTQLQQHMI